MGDSAIVVEGLTKRFGSFVAVDDVDLEVPVGSVFGLLGPNGAGKTTVIRILTTILRADRGRADGVGCRRGREPGRGAPADRVGGPVRGSRREPDRSGEPPAHGPSRPALPSASFDPGWRSSSSASSCSRPQRGRSGRTPAGCAAASTSRPRSSRARRCCSSTSRPRGSIPHSRNQLWDLIRELVAANTTVLLTTQYLEEADRLTQRVAVIDRGRVIANDTPANLKALGSTVIELKMADEPAATRAATIAHARGAAGASSETAVRSTSLRTTARGCSSRRCTRSMPRS